MLAKDEETGEQAYKEVEWLFQRDVEETYNITVDGEVITTTDEHPFWIVGKGWVESKNLEVADILTTSNGKELAIEKIDVKKEHTTVYNFKVKDFHTYFVSDHGIWTHNKCGFENKTTKGFWKSYDKLPKEIQKQADEKFELFKRNPDLPGLNFEKLKGFDNKYSVRINDQYRAIGELKDNAMTWIEIIPHTYNKLK